MGSEIVKSSVAELPLWQRYADQFPVRENLLYLNHAAVAPLPRRCADALKHLADDCLRYGSLHYDEWLAAYEGLRVAAARLVNATPREIALVKNTSEGIATLALGLDWRPGDRMVGFKEEFAIQGLGAFPLDVRACHIDALAADGHKWLLGPEGCAILYISQALQERVEPVEFGWTNVAGYNDYGSRDMTLRPDAGRYECGTLNTIGCFGLRASIEFLLEAGPGEIAPVVRNLGDRIAAGVQAKGYDLFLQRTPRNAAGIVTFRKPGVDAAETVRRLRRQNIITAARAGWVRASPHFYISPGEIDRLVETLP
ncbi:MAG: aminotransferase class V-fold PLP-dependent enzyme [Candidatus Solibacter sp.]|nr:aminotransferase class V-fold PLP-dependent enzyme [Candidatus Solibacter sp.]